MTSDTDLRKVLRMLGQAVYSWGIHSLDDDATDDSEIIDNLSTEARTIAERFVRRNVLGDNISRYIPQDVKVAVAVRDQGQCTGKLPDGSRCPRKEKLHFDHRIIHSGSADHRRYGISPCYVMIIIGERAVRSEVGIDG